MRLTLSLSFFGLQADIHDHLAVRRSSYNVESLRGVPRHGNIGSSASKVDILRSALEINHKSSNHSMLSKADNKTSNQSLGRNRADSAPKLNHSNLKNISQPALEGVVLEVSNPLPLSSLSFFKVSPTVCVCVCVPR